MAARFDGRARGSVARLLLLAGGGALLFLELAVAAPASADSPPPASGDWVVDTDTFVHDAPLTVKGNLSVTNGSTLTLLNVQLLFDAPTAAPLWLNVSAGSALEMSFSNIGRANAWTMIAGTWRGNVSLANVTVGNITAAGLAGFTVIDTNVTAAGSTFRDSYTMFTLVGGTITADRATVENITGAFVRIRPSGGSASAVQIAGSRFVRVEAVVDAICGPCAQRLQIEVNESDFEQGIAPYGSVVRVNGTQAADVSITFDGVALFAPDQGLLQVSLDRTLSFTARINGSSVVGGAYRVADVMIARADGEVRVELLETQVAVAQGMNLMVVASDFPVSILMRGSGLGNMQWNLNTTAIIGVVIEDCLAPPGFSNGGMFRLRGDLITLTTRRCSFGDEGADQGGSLVTYLVGSYDVQVENCSFYRGSLFVAHGIGPFKLPRDIVIRNISFINGGGIGFNSLLDDFVNITVDNVILRGYYAASVSFNVSGAQRVSLTNISADATSPLPGGGAAINILYYGRLNLTAASLGAEGYGLSMLVDHRGLLPAADHWTITGAKLNGSVAGLQLLSNSDPNFGPFALVESSTIESAGKTLIAKRIQVQVNNSTLLGPPGHRDIDDFSSAVSLFNTAHDTQAIYFDAGGFLGARLESVWVTTVEVVWEESGRAAAGWNLSVDDRLRQPYLSGTLDDMGRLAPTPRLLVHYRLLYNASDIDARAVTGVLTNASRGTAQISQGLTGNLTVMQLVVRDAVPPTIEIVRPAPWLEVNATSFVLTVRFFDPESGLASANATVIGESSAAFVGISGDLWEGSVVLQTIWNGSFDLQIKTADVAGIPRTQWFTLIVDLTPPTIHSTYPPAGGFVGEATVSVRAWTDDDVAAMTADGISGAFDNGSWMAFVDFSEGPHAVLIDVVDRAGNHAVQSVAFMVDLTPPAASVDGFTDGMFWNDTLLPVTVHKGAQDAVIADGQVHQNASTEFHLVLTLGPGETSHTIVVRDLAGNTAVFTARVTRDLDAPFLRFAGGAGAQGPVVVNVSHILLELETSADTVRVTGDTRAWFPDTFGRVHVELDRPEGAFTVEFDAVDRAGNHGNLTAYLRVDLTPPSLVSSSPPAGSRVRFQHGDVQLFLSEECDVFFGGRQVAAQASGATLSLFVVEGENLFPVALVDSAGNREEATLRLVGDFTAPSLEVTTPANHTRTPSGSTHIEGRTDAGSRVLVAGQPVSVGADGRFSADFTLAAGTNQIVIESYDDAGNEAVVVLFVEQGETGNLGLPIAAVGGVVAVAALALLARRRKSGRSS